MACFDIDAEDDRGIAALCMLQRCAVFEAVGGEDAIVVIGGGDESGRVGCVLLRVMIG